MTKFFNKLFRDEDGATAVEYALMIALIAAVIIGAVRLLGFDDQGLVHEIHRRV